MLDVFLMTDAIKEAATVPVWWQFFGGPAVGAAAVAGAFGIGKAVADKKVSPAVTVQEQQQALLKGLETMVTLMTEDKAKDTQRIDALQSRVDELEMDSQSELDTLTRLHGEIRTLQAEAARKDTTIRLLVNELRVLGVIVMGLEESAHTTITFVREQ